MTTNILLKTDSYKASHAFQYREGTQNISSYIEARGDGTQDVLFFGLQRYLLNISGRQLTTRKINEASAFFSAHGVPFNREGWLKMMKKHGGFLPIEISALPEGTVVKTSVPLVQLVNTDPEFPWLTSYLETALLRAVWYPTTVATNSREAKKIILNHLEKSGSNVPSAEIHFKLHDFGARGVSSGESAAIGGAAHLINFMGSDTVEGIIDLQEYYGDPTKSIRHDMPAFSIPAAEHSTITSWGENSEEEAYRNMITQFSKPKAMYAVVSDSYDIYNACENLWGGTLRDEVIRSGGTLVIRPDSGHPATVVLKVIKILANKFGATRNDKGYLLLPDYIRVIQGDGINLESIEEILSTLEYAGFSSSNIAFGMGGKLLQAVTRDDLGWAMKANAKNVNGVWSDVYKRPVTDSGKTSKAGIQRVYYKDGKWIASSTDIDGLENLLQPVFRDGFLLRTENYKTIRERAAL